MTQHSISDFNKVIPTAWLTAYGRSFSHIPYTREVFEALEDLCAQADTTECSKP